MQKDDYYKLICSLDPKSNFKTMHKKWFQCFDYVLRSFKAGHNAKTIKSLFYDFDMDNWEALHKENTQYKNYSKKKLIETFCVECNYISDRTSYDRLFRCHWLFKEAFKKEWMEMKYEFIK